MRRIQRHLIVLAALILAGCQSGISGTWKAAPGQDPVAVSFAAMTLAEDGTFTADGRIADRTFTVSGHYTYADNKLTFDSDGTSRSYGAELSGDSLTVTHHEKAAKMTRLMPR